MRTKSKKPGKQRHYEHKPPRHEAHKLLSASLSKKLRQENSFRSLPLREGDTVIIVRGEHKGHSGKVNKADPQHRRIYVDGIVNKKTDNTEIPVPIHPSNVVIDKYVKRDRHRLEIINRRIKEDDQKIDIETVLAEVAAEEEADLIELEDDELDDLGDSENMLLDDDEDFDILEHETKEGEDEE